tara:strand:- start:38 stop:463 length:426 start_codon:yes stop_codon:yes gene_type:complete
MFESVSSPVSAEPLSTGTGPREETFQPKIDSALQSKKDEWDDPLVDGLLDIANGVPNSMGGMGFMGNAALTLMLHSYADKNGLKSKREAAHHLLRKEIDELKGLGSMMPRGSADEQHFRTWNQPRSEPPKPYNENPQPMFR